MTTNSEHQEGTTQHIERLETENRYLKAVLRLVLNSLEEISFWNYPAKERSEDLAALREVLRL